MFRQPNYLENFVQATLEAARIPAGGTLVLGGDGRYLNREGIRFVLRIAAANRVGRVIVGAGGILSTPVASCVIRKRSAGRHHPSANHNPGGPHGDFGIKYNIANGGPAPEKVTAEISAIARWLKQYRIVDAPDVPLDDKGAYRLGEMTVEIIDPVADYAQLMETLFKFDALRGLLITGRFRMRFDAVHAVTRPYT